MSWEGPDREYGEPVKNKPFCEYRPTVAPNLWSLMFAYLDQRGLNADLARLNDWYPTQDAEDGEPRVVIPCRSANPINLYWQARLLRESHSKFPLRYTSPRHVSRGDAVCVVKPRVVKGYVLVEGPMDALAAAEVGYCGIAWMGTNPGLEPINFARGYIQKDRPVFVVPDTGALNAGVEIWKHFPGSFLVETHPYKDLAEMPFQERKEWFTL